MTASLRALAVAAALLVACPLVSQTPDCRHGRADDRGVGVRVTLLAHPTRVAAVLDSVLRAQGYEVAGSPSGLGSWDVRPRFTWPAEAPSETWHGDEHPGVVLLASTQARGDSTGLSLTAQSICRVPPLAGMEQPVDQMVEVFTATMLAAGVAESMDSLRARGTDLMAPVDRPRSVQAPAEVAGFAIVGRHDYPDPSYGTTVRYARDKDDLFVDIYLYPGVRVDETCDAACAVDSEADGFVKDFPELVRAGRYEQVERTADEQLRPGAGAAWAYGRHMTLKLRSQGRTLDSHYWLYSFPGFFLKVRASYPPTSRDAPADVRAFVDELLGKILS